MKQFAFCSLVAAALWGMCLPGRAQTLPAPTPTAPQLKLVQWATNLSNPVEMVSPGPTDKRLFIVEQRGLIRIADSVGALTTTPFLNLSTIVSATGSERGLLGMAFDPNYATNGYFYLNYTQQVPTGQHPTKIVRYTRSATNPNLADPASDTLLLTVPQPYTNHNGGNIQFGPDGYLYIGMGDGGSGGDPGNRAQNTHNLLGKMLRLDVHNPNSLVPPTSPFALDTAYNPLIWDLGVRNPWRFTFDKLTGELWIADVGQNVWEEVNREPAGSGGHNYGWRWYEGTHIYDTTMARSSVPFTMPGFQYPHGSYAGCSITGGYVYRGGLYRNLFGKYLTTDYCSGRIWALTPNATGTLDSVSLGKFFTNTLASFAQDRYGELYLLGRNTGKIWKLTDSAACKPVAAIQAAATTICASGGSVLLRALPYHPSLTYAWQRNGVPFGTGPSLTAVIAGQYRVIVTAPAGCKDTSSVLTLTPTSPAITMGYVANDSLTKNYAAGITPFVAVGAGPIGGTYHVYSPYFRIDSITGQVTPTLATATLQNVWLPFFVSYTYTDATGCTGRDSLRVFFRRADTSACSVLLGLALSRTDTLHLCPGRADTLTATGLVGTYRYAWLGPGPTLPPVLGTQFNPHLLLTAGAPPARYSLFVENPAQPNCHDTLTGPYALDAPYPSVALLDSVTGQTIGGSFNTRILNGTYPSPFRRFTGVPAGGRYTLITTAANATYVDSLTGYIYNLPSLSANDTTLLIYTLCDTANCNYCTADTVQLRGTGTGTGLATLPHTAASLLLFPNPTQGAAQARIVLAQPMPAAHLRLSDALGRTVHSQTLALPAGTTTIALPTLPPGPYRVEALNDRQHLSQTLLVR